MIVFPNAKINLGLRITGKRNDGYHDIETFFYPVHGLADILEVIENKEDTIDTFNTSGIKLEGSEKENLVLKALQIIRNNHEIPPLKIHLHKTIPAGAGLGGGSSDAAFMLKLLNDQFQLNLNRTELESMAAQLGADCAFFIGNTPALASGIGDQLTPTPFNLKNLWLQLVVAPIHISTPEAYGSVTPQKPDTSLQTCLFSNRKEWPQCIFNDFEKSIYKNHPALEKIKQRMYGQEAIYASLSGSGSAIFGLFEKDQKIQWPGDFFTWEGQME